MTRVLVIGGGITGLATAWMLRHGADDGGATDVEVTVLEASDRIGGKILTREVAGATVDVGADAFLARRPEAERLARRLGLGDDLVAPATGDVWLWARGELRPLPKETVLGVPSDLDAVAATGLLTDAGLARARQERTLPATALTDDTSLGDHVAERFGDEVADLLVEPLLGGVYAGDVRRISLEVAAPPVWAVARQGRSLTDGLAAHRARVAADDRPVFLTVDGGLGRMLDALVAGIGDVRTGVAVARLRADGDVVHADLSDGSTVTADHVVVTAPAPAAAAILTDAAPVATALLDELRYASVAVVTLAYDRAVADDAPRGSGMLVPRVEGKLVKAATWSSRKWPHLADGPRFLLRASVGRIGDQRHAAMDDADLAAAVAAEVSDAMGLPAPLEATVARWNDALPQYDVGHRRWVEDVRAAATAASRRIHLAGAAYDGIGIAPCVAQAEAVARRITGGH